MSAIDLGEGTAFIGGVPVQVQRAILVPSPKKRAYAGWPAGAEQLHRHFSAVAPRSNPGFSHLRQGFAEAIWKCLAAGDGEVRGLFRFGAQYLSPSNLRYGELFYRNHSELVFYNTVWARDALAWFALAKELPFKVPTPFLAKIREDFDEDLPWLCLADWAEEQGQGEKAAELRAAVKHSGRSSLPLHPMCACDDPAERSRAVREDLALSPSTVDPEEPQP